MNNQRYYPGQIIPYDPRMMVFTATCSALPFYPFIEEKAPVELKQCDGCGARKEKYRGTQKTCAYCANPKA